MIHNNEHDASFTRIFDLLGEVRQTLQRIAEARKESEELRLPDIDWGALDSEAFVVAWDKNGRCWQYENEPDTDDVATRWTCSGGICGLLPQYNLPPFPDDSWKRAIVRRPAKLALPDIDWDALPKTPGGDDVQSVAWDRNGSCHGYNRFPNSNSQYEWSRNEWTTGGDSYIPLPKYDLPPFTDDSWKRTVVRRPPHAFRITGPGVYETRDGREATVEGPRDNDSQTWVGTIPGVGFGFIWREDGLWNPWPRTLSRTDLVRYLRPLPPAIDWGALPKPFRVDKPGLYRRRDGEVEEVSRKNSSSPGGQFGLDNFPWMGQWSNRGRHFLMEPSGQRDLIAYIGPLESEVPMPDWDQIPRWLGNHVRWSRRRNGYVYKNLTWFDGDDDAWFGRGFLLPASVCPRLPEGIDWRTAKADRPEGEQG